MRLLAERDFVRVESRRSSVCVIRASWFPSSINADIGAVGRAV